MYSMFDIQHITNPATRHSLDLKHTARQLSHYDGPDVHTGSNVHQLYKDVKDDRNDTGRRISELGLNCYHSAETQSLPSIRYSAMPGAHSLRDHASGLDTHRTAAGSAMTVLVFPQDQTCTSYLGRQG
jgi:hypothetical protein